MHISEAISKLKFAYYLFLSEHGITRKTQIFLHSNSVPKRNHQMYFDLNILSTFDFPINPLPDVLSVAGTGNRFLLR